MTIVQNQDAPQLDAGGQLLPAQGAAPGTPPAAPGQAGILAGSGLEGMVAGYLQHITDIAKNSPVAQKTRAAEIKNKLDATTPVDQNRPPAPAPGSFGDKLVGAAQGVLSDFGDAAHAHDTKGGWLSGIANVENARNQRLAQAQKDQSLIAKTQAETVMMHRNIYQQDQAIRQSSYKGNQDFVDTFKVNHDVEEGLTHDELMKRATSDKNFAAKYYVRATGEQPVTDANGEPTKDKSGNPITSPTYTIVSRATKDGQKDDKVVSPQMSADMNKFLGTVMPANTKLTVDQYAALDTTLNNARNATNILNATNEKELTPDQQKSLSTYMTDPTIQSAISHVPGSAYAGLLQYQKNADAHIDVLNKQADDALAQNNQKAYDAVKTQIADLQQEKQKVATFAAQAIAPKQIERYEKDNETADKWLDKIMHDPAALAGDKASSVLPQLEAALKTSTDPGLSAKLTSAISTAKTARDNYFEDQKRKATADQLAKQGDPIVAGKNLAEGLVTLADLKTRGTTVEFINQAIEAARKIDGNYNPADEVNFEHQAKSAAASQFFGAARSMMEKAGTSDIVYNLGKRLPDSGFPTLNTLEDWTKLKTGKGPLAGYASAILGLADDYSKVMGGGAASDNARDHALALFGAAATQEQRTEALQSLLADVGSQFHGRVGNNKFFQREYDNFERSALTPAPKAAEAPANIGQQTIEQKKAGVNTGGGARIGSDFKDDPSKRPAGYQGVILGSDNNWYYYDKNHKILGLAPAQQ